MIFPIFSCDLIDSLTYSGKRKEQLTLKYKQKTTKEEGKKSIKDIGKQPMRLVMLANQSNEKKMLAKNFSLFSRAPVDHSRRLSEKYLKNPTDNVQETTREAEIRTAETDKCTAIMESEVIVESELSTTITEPKIPTASEKLEAICEAKESSDSFEYEFVERENYYASNDEIIVPDESEYEIL